MGARTSGREAALQVLFACDAGKVAPDQVDQLLDDFWREVAGDVEGREFADTLVRSVLTNLTTIDQHISNASRHWRIERMARVDRNILRIGVQELAHQSDVPRAVIIDEAVELAKRFGAQGSSVFVNGVLDRIADELKR